MVAGCTEHVSCHVREERSVNGLRAVRAGEAAPAGRGDALKRSMRGARCTNADRRSHMAMNTLPDAVRPGLRALAVGINPSLPSVREGFCFANPRNRFWPALNASRLVDAPLAPGPDAVAVLVERYGIGFTDVVKRPTAGSAELRPREYREGAARLEAMVLRLDPGVVWFQGAQAWRAFARHAGRRIGGRVEWGPQQGTIGRARIFVTPNPSPANASYRLADLVRWLDVLADFLPPRPPPRPM